MRSYILRRILLFIPTLIIITLLSFIILVHAPGDPVERMMTASTLSGDISTQSIAQQEQRAYWTHRLGLDLPLFYFSIQSLAEPDTFYLISDKRERLMLTQLLRQSGDWNKINAYYRSLSDVQSSSLRLRCRDTSENCQRQNEIMHQIDLQVAYLKQEAAPAQRAGRLKVLQQLSLDPIVPAAVASALHAMQESYEMAAAHAARWKNYVPVLRWHRMNQYHRWLFGDRKEEKGLLRGDAGISYLTKQPVGKMIRSRIGWSLFFTLTSVFLAYLISIPLAIRSAARKNSAFDHITSLVLYLLYSLPVFWVATLLLMSFANTDALNLFPASGVKPVTGYPPDASWIERLRLSLSYLILPTICYVYSSFAFLTRTLRVSMLEILSQDFIRTARAKGLNEKKVLWKHALRNSLLPVITLFANVFPFMLGGSVILESIFTIPGMGSLIYNSIDAQDYPVIVAVFTLTGILTMTGYLVSDILYAFADPRISFSKKTTA